MNMFGHEVVEKSALMDYEACVHVCVCAFTPDACQSEWSLGIVVFWEQLTVTSGTALALLWIFIYFLFNHVFVDHLKKILPSFFALSGDQKHNGSPSSIPSGPFFPTKTKLIQPLLIGFVIFFFVSFYFVISLRDSLPAQLWRLVKVPGRRICRYCMISSIMPVCKHPLCSNTGKRIRKVDRVLLLVCAKLSTWMVEQGTSADCSPFRQKRSLNSSSCVCEVAVNLQEEPNGGKEVP